MSNSGYFKAKKNGFKIIGKRKRFKKVTKTPKNILPQVNTHRFIIRKQNGEIITGATSE